MVAVVWRPAGQERVLPGTSSQLPKPPVMGNVRGRRPESPRGQPSQDSGQPWGPTATRQGTLVSVGHGARPMGTWAGAGPGIVPQCRDR